MSWASILKKAPSKAEKDLSKPPVSVFKKLDKNSIIQNQTIIVENINEEEKPVKINFPEKIKEINEYTEEDFRTNLYNNYEKIFRENNTLNSNSCSGTYHFFMNYSKPIFDDIDDTNEYSDESDYCSE